MDSVNDTDGAAQLAKEQREQQEKYAEIMRALWRHENDLMSARFGWFTTLQGLLFTALAFAWRNEVRAIVWTICALGIAVAIATMGAFYLGVTAWKKLGKWWDGNLAGYEGPPITGHYEPLPEQEADAFYEDNTAELVPIPWKILPLAFLLAWSFISIYVGIYGVHMTGAASNP